MDFLPVVVVGHFDLRAQTYPVCLYIFNKIYNISPHIQIHLLNTLCRGDIGELMFTRVGSKEVSS